MKVLLVTSPHLNHSCFLVDANPLAPAPARQYAQAFAPMGLISLAGAARSEATVGIADLNKAINQSVLSMSASFYDEAAEWLLSHDADLIGFMTEVDSYHHILRICDQIKSRKPDTLTLLGGVHASAVHEETLKAFPSVDFVIRGEGEIAFSSFLATLKDRQQLATVNNLSYRANGRIMANPSLPLIDDLDTLPFPDFSCFDLATDDIIYLEVGRGCPFKCNFCFTASYWQRKHRIKSAARVIKELNYFKNTYQRTDFNLTHDLLTTDRRWVLNFCRELADAQLDVSWTCSSRTDTIDEEQILWMKRAGCREIYFGVETGTAEMQTKIDKNLDLAEAERIISATTKAGIGATVGFIAGLPGETVSSLRSTLGKALHFLSEPTRTVHVFGYYPNSGSPNFENVKSRLVFDEHFVDFPLGEMVHAENCRLMKDNFPIFSRYSRLDDYGDLPLATIRAADEFFPMINPLRRVMLAVQERGVDLLDVLHEWARWIESHNRKLSASSARRYQGTVSEFLDFLELHLRNEGVFEEVIAEMIQWERNKNTLRSKPLLPQPLVSTATDYDAHARFTNPSVIINHFKHAGEFLRGSGIQGGGFFAFYSRLNGEPEIVRLEQIAILILDLAKQGMNTSDLFREMKSLAHSTGVRSRSQVREISRLIEQLQELDLLVPFERKELDHVGPIPQGVKPGYIPLLN